jgi:hypothetical protein
MRPCHQLSARVPHEQAKNSVVIFDAKAGRERLIIFVCHDQL